MIRNSRNRPSEGHALTKIGRDDYSRKFVTLQQPAGDTPGVAAAPVALAGAIVPGVARLIVMLSAHADVFGVGITPVVGSMLVSASTATGG
jgi:hypothetical protein